jgi:drug/metabolite transporter (DMT)-like permease
MPSPTDPTTGRRPLAGAAAALGGVVLWGSLVVLVKTGEETNGLVIGFHRIWVGALGVALVALAVGRFPDRRAFRLSLAGGLLFAADIVLFFSAIKLTTVANATIVGALQPMILLYVGARQFGERITGGLVVLTAIAVGGAALVAVGSADATGGWSPLGDLLAVAALATWAGYFAASKQARRSLGTLEYLTAFLVIAAVCVAPVAVAFGGGLAVDGETWAVILVLALGSGAVGHFLMNWSHGHIPLYLASLLTLSLPAVSAVSAALFLGEPLIGLQVMGIAVVVGALAVVVHRTEAPDEVTPTAEELTTG